MRFLITGGAGFIGSNAAHRFRELGHDVVVLDSFARPASRFNRAWLESLHPEIRFVEADVRDSGALRRRSASPSTSFSTSRARSPSRPRSSIPPRTTRSTPSAPSGSSRSSESATPPPPTRRLS